MPTSEKRLPMLMARFCTALRFLTIVPVSWRAADDPQQFNKCLMFFPLVGALVGLVGCLGAYIVAHFFPQQVVAVVSLIYLAFISGFLHLDGLSDSADGLLSVPSTGRLSAYYERQQGGGHGGYRGGLLMLVKYSALSSMAAEEFYLALFFMPLAGRSAILLSMARLPYARPEGGLGSLFYSDRSRKAAVVAFIALLFFLAILAPAQVFVVRAAILAINLIFGRWCRNQLGGATGDTLGAVCELTEAVTAVAFTASFSFF